MISPRRLRRIRHAVSRAHVVVGGAGGSGAPRPRAWADPGREVLLIEAGPAPAGRSGFPPEPLDARLVPGAWPERAPVWSYPAHLAPDRPCTIARGRYLGGSTTVNGGYFIRARRDDFDRWAAAGNDAWSFDRMAPFLRRLETGLDYGVSDVHGGSGSVRVRRTWGSFLCCLVGDAQMVVLRGRRDREAASQDRFEIGVVACGEAGQDGRAGIGATRSRPPPGRRTLSGGPSPALSSNTPRRTVVSLLAAARATALTPPWPRARAAAAISNRRCRSPRRGNNTANLKASWSRVSSGMRIPQRRRPEREATP
jgi:hypothetical protein